MSLWSLVYDDFDPRKEKLRETLCTLGNGLFCTRGAFAQAEADEVHYPGTYLAGGYNRLKSDVEETIIENEDLVNLPNWLPLEFRIEGGDWFRIDNVERLSFRQALDMRQGILVRNIRFQDEAGRRTRLEENRLVSMGDAHQAGLLIRLAAENWSGRIEVRTALDGRVVNAGVERYQGLADRHLEPLESFAFQEDLIYLKVRTNQSRIEIAQAAATRVFRNGDRLAPERRETGQPGYIAQEFAIEAREGDEIAIEKIVTLFTSRDSAISEAGLAAREGVAAAGRFDDLLSAHVRAWHHLWRRFDIQFEHRTPAEGERTGMILHLHLFHLLQTTSTNTMDLDAGVPSRGWHGEAYRGHILWDELFIFPLLTFRLPAITHALLMYRFRRLDRARLMASRAGLRGALYPWQSGSDGREESQEIHLNPASGRWIPDNTHLQRHVNAAIAYNAFQFYQVTGDREFLSFYGSEMIAEIARLFASLAVFNPGIDRYEIKGVMGPDEYHDAYPGAETPGLDNNAYTNVMAVWVLCRALTILEKLLPEDRSRELRETIGLEKEEIELWRDISRRMKIPFHDDGIISQFDGYENLKEFDWEGYREKYGNIQRLDRILEAEGDSPNHYQVSKQADVLMLFYLLSSEELGALFKRLEYPFRYETIPRNIDYYLKRTSHGSTLSFVVHAWVLARSDRVRSWKLFREALQTDVADIQGGTTTEGIHLGAMAGTVDLIKRGYTGLEPRGDVLWFNPRLPEQLACIRMQIRYRGHTLDMVLTTDKLRITALRAAERSIRIGYQDKTFELSAEETREFAL